MSNLFLIKCILAQPHVIRFFLLFNLVHFPTTLKAGNLVKFFWTVPINQFVLHLLRKYFSLLFRFSTNEFKLTFKTVITEIWQQDIQLIRESLGYLGDYIFDVTLVDLSGDVEFKPYTHLNMETTTSGLIHKQFPNSY